MTFRIVVVLLSSVFLVRPVEPRHLVVDRPIACTNCAEWNQPHEPFRIYGNTYYVGVAGLSSVLIVSSGGLVLVDGALPQSVAMIDANIGKLGFKTEDVKLILNGHTHFDHAGGLHALQQFTGATVATGVKGVNALQLGKPVPEDPQAADPISHFPPVSNVRGVADGEILRVGEVEVTAHATPGHTPGGTTWTWRSCESGRCLTVVYADSLTAVSSPGYRFTGDRTHASIVDTFRSSVRKFAALPCDILIAAHPSVGDLDGKLKLRHERPSGPNPFIDPNACRVLADSSMKGLDARIAEETKQ